MGARGPLPQTATIRQLRGNPGNHTTPATIKAKPIAPKCPVELTGLAAEAWATTVPLLEELGVLGQIDQFVLTQLCRTWAIYCEAADRLGSDGVIVPAQKGEDRKSPAWQIFREASAMLSALEKELLATPLTRVRTIKPEVDEDDTSDIFD